MAQIGRLSGLLCVAVTLLACGGEGGSGPPAEQDAGREDAGSRKRLDDVSSSRVSDSWLERETACGYSFLAPPELASVPVQGIDSCVSQFESAGCELTGDFGNASNTLLGVEREPNGELENTTIDGEPARIVSFGPGGYFGRYVVAVHVPADYEPGPKLTLTADCVSRDATAFVLPLFRTIHLPRR